jgi:hypothetical protein
MVLDMGWLLCPGCVGVGGESSIAKAGQMMAIFNGLNNQA